MENGDTESGGGLVTAPLPVDVWDKAAAWLLLESSACHAAGHRTECLLWVHGGQS